MQMIERTVKRIMIALIVFTIVSAIIIKYAFNINSFRQIIIFAIGLIAISIFTYFYFHPSFIIRKRREIFLLIFSLVIIFILMETVLRINECGWKWDVTLNDEIKYKYEKSTKICNSIIDGKRFYLKTNNEGFIDDDFKFNTEDYNIFLVGDSYAACLESNYGSCVHQKLEKDLKEKYGSKINIMNFGVSSYSGLAELAVIKKYVDVYKPKMIILYFYVNDLQENRDYVNKAYVKSEPQKIIRTITPKTLLFFFSNGKNLIDKIFIRFAWYRNLSGLESQAVDGHAMYLKDYNSEWQDLLDTELDVLNETYKIALERNITIMHVATTAKEQVYPELWIKAFESYPSLKLENYNSSKPNDVVMSYAKERGIPHLDLLPLFKNNPNNLHWVDGHWNDQGQLFAEEKIKDYIIKNNLVKLPKILK